ncbi:post-transcriptional regulator [Paenibacillus sp. J2TS4]|uniref:post-transcriptional regulator n=1 Tax=Paenibacillus sp. J2TS4 TaxID=2807194 RepID=UPI001B009BD8|nr:post-transcriptional regulator [Paenibacillus sp. J2TS4]GIP31400.1 hypothetical protein J2TS4_06100 [Paenibacillus sp. J2TS4]
MNPESPRMEDNLEEVIMHLCQMKAEEFAASGYEQVSANEIWSCVSDKYSKTGQPALHQLVNDILSLSVPKFMNWMTMQAFKGAPF